MKDLMDVPKKVREGLKSFRSSTWTRSLGSPPTAERVLEASRPRRRREEAGESAEDKIAESS